MNWEDLAECYQERFGSSNCPGCPYLNYCTKLNRRPLYDDSVLGVPMKTQISMFGPEISSLEQFHRALRNQVE